MRNIYGAWLRSAKGKGAGAWLNVVHSTSKLTIVSHNFRLATCLRLSLSMPFNQCDCGSGWLKVPSHDMQMTWGPVWTNDCISNVWYDCLKSLQMHHRREPRHRYITFNNHTDIHSFFILV